MMNEEELSALRFGCIQCGSCCGGAPGYVFLKKGDIEAISKNLQMSEEEFIKSFCRRIVINGKRTFSLKEKPNFDCIFLYDKKCKIYEARPIQCRTYPFWTRIIDSKASWEKEKKHCPGIGKGDSVSVKKILEIIQESQ